MEIEKNKIRLFFYLGTTSIVLLLLILLSAMFLNTYKTESENKTKQLSASIYDMKKIYLKDIIDRTIQDIDIERESIISQESDTLTQTKAVLNHLLLEPTTSNAIYAHILDEGITPSYVQILIYNRDTQVLDNVLNSSLLVNRSLSEAAFRKLFEGYPLTSLLEGPQTLILMGIHSSYIEEQVQTFVTHRIRSERLVDNGYIWINQIIDYNGGDNYAIRLVHPNLPETEGSYLSTYTTDIQGKKPYQLELEGIKKDGELFNDYYFKKLDSDIIAHKLSYAKLYKPYDWVIATGVYLDDIDTLIANESVAMKKSQDSVVFNTLLLSLISLVVSALLIYIFERLIARLIHKFQNIVTLQNKEIQLEKEKIEEIAYIDPLTGLLNRRAVLTRIQDANSRANRYNEYFSIAICDIDYFKKINDTYGHTVGDYILQSFSTLLKENLRQEDVIARWGGEEFLVLLNYTTPETAFAKIDRIRELIEETTFQYGNQVIKLTASFGIATYKPQSLSFEPLITEADNNLYHAKNAGRNKVFRSAEY